MREALGLGLAANEGFWNSISTEFHLTAPELENPEMGKHGTRVGKVFRVRKFTKIHLITLKHKSENPF